MSSDTNERNLLDEVRDIVVTATGVTPGHVTPEATISSLAIDSLSLVEIAVRIEDAFGVHLNDQDIFGFTTVGDILQFLDKHLSAQEAK